MSYVVDRLLKEEGWEDDITGIVLIRDESASEPIKLLNGWGSIT